MWNCQEASKRPAKVFAWHLISCCDYCQGLSVQGKDRTWIKATGWLCLTNRNWFAPLLSSSARSRTSSPSSICVTPFDHLTILYSELITSRSASHQAVMPMQIWLCAWGSCGCTLLSASAFCLMDEVTWSEKYEGAWLNTVAWSNGDASHSCSRNYAEAPICFSNREAK